MPSGMRGRHSGFDVFGAVDLGGRVLVFGAWENATVSRRYLL